MSDSRRSLVAMGLLGRLILALAAIALLWLAVAWALQ
jgi:hypothetical protein